MEIKKSGLCRTDYALWKRTGGLELAVTRRSKHLDTATHKSCVKCEKLMPREDFYRSSKAKDGRRGECKPCMKAINRQSYYNNHEANIARQREVEASPERRAYVLEYRKTWIPAHRERAADLVAIRRARIREATIDDGITLRALRERYGSDCYFCGETTRFGTDCVGKRDPLMASIEHLQPLCRGGAHSWENVRIACLRCNISKNKKTEAEFMAYRAAVALGRTRARGH
ncbi:HNH endonuclease [Pseudoclavibacter helvolus]|uniref:HNH endonuclease n=1 Tax=Pseudoclavibacter helvolus TaxID=255205 RepID=UPI003C759A55